MGIHGHFKRWFVPHKHNDHRPHLIRAHGLAIMAILILGVQASAYALEPTAVKSVPHGHVLAYATNITPEDLFIQTNQQRADNGLAPLRLDARLNESATLKANDMFANNYWAHVSPSGVQPWYWFTLAGYNYNYAGENLAKDFDTTAGVMDGWMNSPGHRANILNANYVDVGFAVENGTLVGGQTTLVVAHYGSPAIPAVAAATPAPSSAPRAAALATPAPPVAVAGTPAPTPATAATPTPSPSPGASVSPHAPVVADGEISPGEPAAKSYSLFDPLSLARTASPATLTTIALLFILLLVYVFTHLAVWRKGLKRWRNVHYRLFAAAQVSGLTLVILSLAATGFGKVG